METAIFLGALIGGVLTLVGIACAVYVVGRWAFRQMLGGK